MLVYAYIHTKESDVTLDGQLNEAFWAQARAIRPVPRDPAAANDDTSELRFALTNDALYVGIRQPIEKTAAIWEVSVMTANRQGTQVALYGQPNGNISVYFCASPATGMIAVTGRKSTASVVSVKSTDHVTAEFRVPRTDLPTTAKAYDALLVNVGTFPESDSKTPCHVSSPWLIGTSPTYNPAFFGSLQLGRH